MCKVGNKIEIGTCSQPSRARNPFPILHLGSHSPMGMTLVELLVVIVILTTLVASIVPILSPNNDARKIREASRELHAYITLAQAKAARSGRPVGIAFQESSAGSGVALEAFQLQVPKWFAGFSEDSRVRMQKTSFTYNPDGNDGMDFASLHNGRSLYNISFELAGGTNPDLFPPGMIRIGDIIDIEGKQLLIVDDGDPDTQPNLVDGSGFLVPDASFPTVCVWLNDTGQVASYTQRRYKIIRQPVNSTESPLQLPSGVAIDMQGSVTEGNADSDRFPIGKSLFDGTVISPNQNVVGIMFSPTGSVDNIFLNGEQLTSVSKLVLLIGRVENGGIDPTATPSPWVWQSGTEIEEVQERINWLNSDSRLLAIITRNGRSSVNEVAYVAPSSSANIGANDYETAEFQIEAAHEFIREMKRGGGG